MTIPDYALIVRGKKRLFTNFVFLFRRECTFSDFKMSILVLSVTKSIQRSQASVFICLYPTDSGEKTGSHPEPVQCYDHPQITRPIWSGTLVKIDGNQSKLIG